MNPVKTGRDHCVLETAQNSYVDHLIMWIKASVLRVEEPDWCKFQPYVEMKHEGSVAIKSFKAEAGP